ncbi:MAG: VWA domain-containing protein [Anaerolineaceae bacterium]|nr:VWA domain-containing protein [Anaerolineaceae bacterium]
MNKKPLIFPLMFTALLILFCNVSAQEPLTIQIRRSHAAPFSDKIGYTVNLYVSVLDSSGKPLRGLGMENFKVYEDSLPQTLTEARSAEDEPVSAALVMDMSGSMLGQALYDPQAAANFLRMLNRNDHSAVIAFNDRISILQRYTADHGASINAVMSALPENGRGSCIYDAIYEGLELSLSQTSGRRAVVIFTDGKDELIDGSGCSARPLSDVLNFALENRIPVFTIGIGSSTDDKELQRIAETTGGSFIKVTPYTDMESALNTIYAQLYHEYKLTYKTENTAGDHTVLAEVEKDTFYGKNSAALTLPAMPTIMRFQSPEEGSAQQGEVLLSVAFLTQSSEVANVEYFCNGQQLGKVISYPYDFRWDISQMEPGIVIAEAIAYDKENRELARASRMLFVQEAAAAIPTEAPTTVPTQASTATPLPVKEEKTGTNPILLISLGALGAAVVILVILLGRKKSKPESETPVYIPPVNYAAFSDPQPEPTQIRHKSPAGNTELAKLTVTHCEDNSLAGNIYRVNFLPYTLGRSPDNDAVFTQVDRSVGRHHAVLEEQYGQIVIRDLNSRFGTYVNEQKTETGPVILKSGDVIRLGSRMTLKFTKITDFSDSGTDNTAIFDNSASEVGETMIKYPDQNTEIGKTVRVVRLGKNKRN